jgi:hypothetical protein
MEDTENENLFQSEIEMQSLRTVLHLIIADSGFYIKKYEDGNGSLWRSWTDMLISVRTISE